MHSNIETLKNWIAESNNIVFFGGAGVSTESGIPDFRSVDGLYHQKFDYPPEMVISHSFYLKNPAYFFRFCAKYHPPAAGAAGAGGQAAGRRHAEYRRAASKGREQARLRAPRQRSAELLHPLP